MLANYIQETELLRLQKEQATICVTIIVPVHNAVSGKKAAGLEAEKIVQKARQYLSAHFEENEYGPVINSINELFSQADFSHKAEGLGIFVSPSIRKLIYFYLPVVEKVVIAERFEIRDLIYQSFYSANYLALILSTNHVRLFEGRLGTLDEVTDENFPLHLEEDYEYSKPNRGLSYEGYSVTKEYEREKSQLKEIRMENFLRKVDHLLPSYIENDVPLVVTGVKKDLAAFRKVSHFAKNAAEIEGNYFHVSKVRLKNLVWTEVKTHFLNKKKQHIQLFEESYEKGTGICGIQEIWTAIREGRGLHLLLEKDFSFPGYASLSDESRLMLVPPSEPHRVLPDAVSVVIEQMLEKQGLVTMVDNGLLNRYKHIALILRY